MRKPKILIVDDETAHLEAIMDIIEKSGNSYGVLQALDGETAFQIPLSENTESIDSTNNPWQKTHHPLREMQFASKNATK